MKALFHTGFAPPWVHTLGLESWALAPLAGRPLLEYWLGECDRMKIPEVCLLLGEGAAAVEAFAGDGARWGLRISYRFLGPEETPRQLLARSPDLWAEGLFFVSGPLLPRRPAEPPPLPTAPTGLYRFGVENDAECLLGADAAAVQPWLDGRAPPPPTTHSFTEWGFVPTPLTDLKDFFDLNMALVRGESARYVRPGYYCQDGVSIGYNTVVPPAVQLTAPLILGSHSRLSPLNVVGPDVVLGDRCLVERQSELRRCVILDGTYIGRHLEIDGKIVVGRRLIDPADGTHADLDDPWLLASVHSSPRPADYLRGAVEWLLALGLALVQVLPFFLCGGPGRSARREVHAARRRQTLWLAAEWPPVPPGWGERLFRALALDRFPALVQVLAGRLWLCGHSPFTGGRDDVLRAELTEYFPAAFTYATARPEATDPLLTRMDAAYYSHHRSLGEDLRILLRTLGSRLAALFTTEKEPPA